MRILFVIFSMCLYSFLWSQKSIDRDVSITIDENGKKERTMKILVVENGEEKAIEWKDNGKIPADILQQLEEMGIEEIVVDMENIYDVDGGIIISADETYSNKKPKLRGSSSMKRGKEFYNEKSRKKMGRVKKNRHSSTRSEWSMELSDAYIGAQVQSADSGVEVLELIKDGPADEAKLQRGDIITSINGARTRSMESMLNLLNYYESNDKVELLITRSGKEKKVKMVLGKRPEYYRM